MATGPKGRLTLPHRFFSRVDRVLRRSLGVSETAPTDTNVKPAPPVDPKLPGEEEEVSMAAPEEEEDDKFDIDDSSAQAPQNGGEDEDEEEGIDYFAPVEDDAEVEEDGGRLFSLSPSS